MNNQIKTGQISRPRPDGVVAIGTLAGEHKLRLDKKEVPSSYTNPKREIPFL